VAAPHGPGDRDASRVRHVHAPKPRQNIVYLSAELNRLYRIRVSTDISIRASHLLAASFCLYRGSRSFGAKNNDLLQVFVFTGLLERLF
jgi:hypothetical protein